MPESKGCDGSSVNMTGVASDADTVTEGTLRVTVLIVDARQVSMTKESNVTWKEALLSVSDVLN